MHQKNAAGAEPPPYDIPRGVAVFSFKIFFVLDYSSTALRSTFPDKGRWHGVAVTDE